MFVKKLAHAWVVTLLVAPVVSNGCGKGVGSAGGLLFASGMGGIVCSVCGTVVVGGGEPESDGEGSEGESEAVRKVLAGAAGLESERV